VSALRLGLGRGWGRGVIRSSARVSTGSGNRRIKRQLNYALIPSHPPPHAGCPRSDPGPLRVL